MNRAHNGFFSSVRPVRLTASGFAAAAKAIIALSTMTVALQQWYSSCFLVLLRILICGRTVADLSGASVTGAILLRVVERESSKSASL